MGNGLASQTYLSDLSRLVGEAEISRNEIQTSRTRSGQGYKYKYKTSRGWSRQAQSKRPMANDNGIENWNRISELPAGLNLEEASIAVFRVVFLGKFGRRRFEHPNRYCTLFFIWSEPMSTSHWTHEPRTRIFIFMVPPRSLTCTDP